MLLLIKRLTSKEFCILIGEGAADQIIKIIVSLPCFVRCLTQCKKSKLTHKILFTILSS